MHFQIVEMTTQSPALMLKDKLPSECGIRSVTDEPAHLLQSPRIVKGTKSKPGSHPWMVYLCYFKIRELVYKKIKFHNYYIPLILFL